MFTLGKKKLLIIDYRLSQSIISLAPVREPDTLLIQVHKCLRALRRLLGDHCEQENLPSSTLSNLLIPLLGNPESIDNYRNIGCFNLIAFIFLSPLTSSNFIGFMACTLLGLKNLSIQRTTQLKWVSIDIHKQNRWSVQPLYDSLIGSFGSFKITLCHPWKLEHWD